jgi:hypothetical protein
MDDYKEHFESDYVERLIRFAAENDVIWFIVPLDKVGNQPE